MSGHDWEPLAFGIMILFAWCVQRIDRSNKRHYRERRMAEDREFQSKLRDLRRQK